MEEFVNMHGVLFASGGLPPSLYKQLFHKLSGDESDRIHLWYVPTGQETQRHGVYCVGG